MDSNETSCLLCLSVFMVVGLEGQFGGGQVLRWCAKTSCVRCYILGESTWLELSSM